MKRKKIILTALYLFLIISTAVIAVMGAVRGAGDVQLGENMVNSGYFKAFTPDSNILCASVYLIALVYMLSHRESDAMPDWLCELCLMGCTSVLVTFTLVVIFLSPMTVMMGAPWTMMYSGSMFHFHVINPILSAVALVISCKGHKFTKKSLAISIIPVFLYSIIYAFCVVITKTWTDFYGFTLGGSLMDGACGDGSHVLSEYSTNTASDASLRCKKER